MGLVVKGPDRVAEVLHADDLAAILGQRAIALDAALIGQLVALADGERRILGDGQRHAVLHSHIAGQLRVADDRAVLAVEAHAVLDVLAVGFITGSLDPGAFHGHVAVRQNAVAVFRRIGLDNAVLDLNIIVSAVNTDVCFRLCFRSAAVDRDLFFCPDRRVMAARLHLGAVRDANRAACVNTVSALAIRRDGTAVNRQTVVRINRRVKAGSLHFSAVRDGDRAACVNTVAALALRRDGAAGNRQLFADKLIQRDVPHSRFNRNIIGAKAAEFDVARAAGDGKFASRDGQRAADIACAALDAEPIQLPGGQIDRHDAPGKGAGVQTAQTIHAQKTQIEDGFAAQHAPAAQHNLSLLVFRKSEISFRKAFGIHACNLGRRSFGKANFAHTHIQCQRGERIGI